MLQTPSTNPVQLTWGRDHEKNLLTFKLKPAGSLPYYVIARGGVKDGMPPRIFVSGLKSTQYVVDMSKYAIEDRAVITSHSYALLNRNKRADDFRLLITMPNKRYVVGFPLAKSGRITQSDLDVGKTHSKLQGNFYAIDISAPFGSDVVSATSGIVAEVESNYPDLSCDSLKYADYSNNVIVLNDDGSQSVYGHLKQHSIPVRVGERVEIGDVIGKVGSSGAAGKAHLHFSVGGILDNELITLPLSFRCATNSAVRPTGVIACPSLKQ